MHDESITTLIDVPATWTTSQSKSTSKSNEKWNPNFHVFRIVPNDGKYARGTLFNRTNRHVFLSNSVCRTNSSFGNDVCNGNPNRSNVPKNNNSAATMSHTPMNHSTRNRVNNGLTFITKKWTHDRTHKATDDAIATDFSSFDPGVGRFNSLIVHRNVLGTYSKPNSTNRVGVRRSNEEIVLAASSTLYGPNTSNKSCTGFNRCPSNNTLKLNRYTMMRGHFWGGSSISFGGMFFVEEKKIKNWFENGVSSTRTC